MNKGFTLLETLLVAALAVLLLALGARSLQPGRGHEQSVAYEIAAQIRAVRQRAISRRAFSGVSFPGTPAASMSLVEGFATGRVRRTYDWSREHPATRIMPEALPFSSESSAWLDTLADRPGVVFDAVGKPSGLTKIGVVGRQFWEVRISADGRVDVQRSEATPPASAAAVAAPLPRSSAINRPPVVLSLDLSPKVHSSMLSGSIQAIVPYGGHLTLEVEASDPDGDRCFVSWSGEDAVFSCGPEQPMQLRNGKWYATCQYRPRVYTAGARQTIRCNVRDEGGLQALGSANQTARLQTGLSGTFAFWATSVDDPEAKPGLWVSSPEGHSVRQVLARAGRYAALSPDGEKIVFGGEGEGGVFVANADGTDPVRLLTGRLANASFSPNGRWVACFLFVDGRPKKLVVTNSSGIAEFQFTVPPTTLPLLVWDANSRYVYFQYVAPASTSAVTEGAYSEGISDASRAVLQTYLVRLDRTDGATLSALWPQEVGNVLYPSRFVGEVRGADPTGKLYGFRFQNNQQRLVREWVGGGRFRCPSVSSPYDGQSIMLEGWEVEDNDFRNWVTGREQFLGYSLWRSDEAEQRRLLLPGVIPFPCVPNWSR
jgi:type II secretory pathway pseudopilin PulG